MFYAINNLILRIYPARAGRGLILRRFSRVFEKSLKIVWQRVPIAYSSLQFIINHVVLYSKNMQLSKYLERMAKGFETLWCMPLSRLPDRMSNDQMSNDRMVNDRVGEAMKICRKKTAAFWLRSFSCSFIRINTGRILCLSSFQEGWLCTSS